jgi:hypothetical protein
MKFSSIQVVGVVAMKVLQTTMIAGVVLFVSTGMSFAADMDGLDVTIRMVESNDVHEMENELRLPESASDSAREHAESEDSRGLTQANESRERGHDNEATHDDEHEGRHDQARDHHEDERDNLSEARDSQETIHEGADDAHEEGQHEQEESHDDQPDNPDSSDNVIDGSRQ